MRMVIAAGLSAAIVVSILAIVVAPALSYLTVIRRLSGKVSGSEAATLWQVTTEIREDYAARLAKADSRIQLLEERVELLRDELVMSRDAMRALQAQMTTYEAAT